jgi:hypothetical protein
MLVRLMPFPALSPNQQAAMTATSRSGGNEKRLAR